MLETENLDISGFGYTNPTSGTFPRTKLWIHCDDGSQIAIYPLIVPNISIPICMKNRDALCSFNELKGLKLAHPPDSNDHFSVSVLIGGNHYDDFVFDNSAVRLANGPKVTNSKLGYLISGPLCANRRDDLNSYTISNPSVTHNFENKMIEADSDSANTSAQGSNCDSLSDNTSALQIHSDIVKEKFIMIFQMNYEIYDLVNNY